MQHKSIKDIIKLILRLKLKQIITLYYLLREQEIHGSINRQFIYSLYSPKNQRTMGKKMENSYPTRSIKQSGGNILRK